MVAGFESLDHGDAKSAAESFRAAHAIMHVPTTLFALARAEVAMGRLIEAHEDLVRLGAMPIRAVEPDAFATARSEGAKLRSDLERRIPSVRITVQGLALDAPLTLALDQDLIPVATLGAPRLVNPGWHTVVATSGDRTQQAKVHVAEGTEGAVPIVFPLPASAAPAAATTSSTSTGVRPATSAWGIGVPAWISIGIGAAAVGVGSITGALAIAAKGSAVQEGCQDNACPPAAQSDAHRAIALGNAATVSFAIAGAAALAAIVSVVFLRPPAEASQASQASRDQTLRFGAGGLEGTF